MRAPERGACEQPLRYLQVRALLAGREALPPECKQHPGRKVCKVEDAEIPSQ